MLSHQNYDSIHKRFYWLISSILLGGALSACQSGAEPDRQDPYFVGPSNYSEILPDAKSATNQYHSAKKGESSSSPIAFHSTPTVSYEDNTLDENISSSIELADYYAAVKQAGWQRWLQAEGPYTVLALPNEILEDYSRKVPGGLMAPSNQKQLSRFIGGTILIGNYSLPSLRKRAQFLNGNVEATTLSGTKIFLRPLPSGEVIVITPQGGMTRFTGQVYPQSNGTLYLLNSIPASEKINIAP
ncbi:hypothetical protein GT348_05610 [Aristophania vespae]|uniref:FAS1 domain-containing protein n=1 Tax=Aristophania vespae TaxID=2697033 RepID=A0A6P1NJD9_9PROT|nr:hypothetical protein [Aristophania vespae]QHI95792.1 hypothetical protein GT348_05610 [Aristophania vespae]UMM63497.1 hypothetical protein DM15PD_04710 [Aristophania vespae]